MGNFISYLEISQRFNSTTKTKRIAVTSTGAELIHTASTSLSNIKRAKISMRANSTGIPVYINFGAVASSTGSLALLRGDGVVEFELNPSDPVRIYAKSTAATSINIIECWSPDGQY